MNQQSTVRKNIKPGVFFKPVFVALSLLLCSISLAHAEKGRNFQAKTPVSSAAPVYLKKVSVKHIENNKNSPSETCTKESIDHQQQVFKNQSFNIRLTDDTPLKQKIPQKNRPQTSINKHKLKEIAYQVVNKTSHDRNAYTQGLVFYQGFLYESSGGLGLSDLRKVDIKTGKTVMLRALPSHFFAEGLSRVNNQLVQLTLKKNQALVYDIDTLHVIDQFQFPGDGWGLVEMAGNLLISNGTSHLRRFDSHTHQLLGEHTVTVNGIELEGINEMEMVNGKIFANIWPTDCIAIIEPSNYHVTAWMNLSSLYPQDKRPNPSAVLNGIAYNSKQQQLFITGKYWPTIYQLKITPLPN